MNPDFWVQVLLIGSENLKTGLLIIFDTIIIILTGKHIFRPARSRLDAPMIPNVLRKKADPSNGLPSNSGTSNNNGNTLEAGLSNSDFRNLLLK